MASRSPKTPASTLSDADLRARSDRALRALLRAQLSPSLTIDGRTVTSADDYIKDDRRLITARWPNGSVSLLLSIRGGAFDISTERGAQCLYTAFEQYLRAAIETNETQASLYTANAYTERREDREAGREISHYGPLSRRIAARSGLPETGMGELGLYALGNDQWRGGAGVVLERLLKLAIIKAHFLDRGKGEMIQGAPLFSIDLDQKGLPGASVHDASSSAAWVFG